eukprot:SAG22_NODE_106_length_19904_cov_14.387175_9_plen_91_part_00
MLAADAAALQVRTTCKALSFCCCASTVFPSETVPFLGGCLTSQGLGQQAPALVRQLTAQICGQCDSMLVPYAAKAAHWLVHAIPAEPGAS